MTTQHPHAYPENFKARITGAVQHRIGDGQLETLPTNQDVDISTAIASYVVSWMAEGHPITVSLSKPDFEYHVEQGNIVVA